MATQRYGLPELAAAQAQKHVTVNTALDVLDSAINLVVVASNLTAPPGSPAQGARYIPAATATGAWTGQEGKVASYVNGSWYFFTPEKGWLCYDQNTNIQLQHNGTAWVTMPLPAQALLGVNATPSLPNRLSVASDAVLLSHDNVTPGTGGLNVTLNKLAAANTLALTLQNNFSTRALIGLLADDNLAFRTSADGTTFFNALTFAASTGQATFNDRVYTGAGSAALPAYSFTGDTNIGMYRVGADQIGFATNGAVRFTLANTTATFDASVTAVSATAANVTANLLGLGGATADATNRLSINTPAVLLNNAGTSIDMTFNKNAAGNDASLSFKTGFSTRAIVGTTGSDAFTLKVSPDGSTFRDAMVVNQTTALMTGRAAGVVPAVQWAKQTADAARADVATAQNVFDAAFDTVTLEAATTYEFEALYFITRAAGVTSHTTGFLFGGTATFTSIDYLVDVSNPTGNILSAASQLWVSVATLVAATAANVSATENIRARLRGTIRCLAAGTLIPQFQYSAAPGGAPTVKNNSSFRLWPVGTNTAGSAGGNWS